MKLFTVQSIALTTLLFASPALAQTNDQTVNAGAGVIAWIVVGLIGGYLASRIVNKTGEGILRDIILGIVGGIVGGIMFRVLGGHGVTGVQPLEHPSRFHRWHRGAFDLSYYSWAATSLEIASCRLPSFHLTET